jgi:hypothetical protein
LCAGNSTACKGPDHLQGPMALIASQIVERKRGFSFVETGYYGCVSKGALVERAAAFKQQKKALRLPGKKRPKETGYFYRNARALARLAKDKQAELDDVVVAVLFRDSDGAASAGRGLWQDKRDSMIRGFADEECQTGVPMVPKPKSEAWIICAVKPDPYRNCGVLESRSGNDNAPHSLKRELAAVLDGLPSRLKLCELVENGAIDWTRIDMPSFDAFRQRLEEVV